MAFECNEEKVGGCNIMAATKRRKSEITPIKGHHGYGLKTTEGEMFPTIVEMKKSNVKRLGYFGKKMPNSTEICPYCKHYHSRNLPGGWSESGCTKHGWKPDGQGGSGKSIGKSYTECKGKDFEYIQRQRRLKPIPKPEWVD